MNSIEILESRYRVLTTWEGDAPYFSGVWKWLGESARGNKEPYMEISQFMKDIEENRNRYKSTDRRIIIESTRQILVFYPDEIKKLALTDEELYIKALKRGKSELRYRANERRVLNGNQRP